ncbi:hypothetical protein ES708_26764 [subsurface metagenome]
MWLIIGLIVGVGLTFLAMQLKNKGISLTWYEWLIGIAGLGLLLYTIQNFAGSFAEFEPTAAWLLVLVLGIPAIILLAIAWLLAAQTARRLG